MVAFEFQGENDYEIGEGMPISLNDQVAHPRSNVRSTPTQDSATERKKKYAPRAKEPGKTSDIRLAELVEEEKKDGRLRERQQQ